MRWSGVRVRCDFPRAQLTTASLVMTSSTSINNFFVKLPPRVRRFAVMADLNTTKVGQIGAKWDKSGIFEDHFSVHFDSESQNILKNDLQKSQMCPFWCQSDPLYD